MLDMVGVGGVLRVFRIVYDMLAIRTVSEVHVACHCYGVNRSSVSSMWVNSMI